MDMDSRHTHAPRALTLFDEVVEQPGPFVAEDVGAREAAIAADAHEVRNAVLH